MKSLTTKSNFLEYGPWILLTLFFLVSTSTFAGWPHHKKQAPDITELDPPKIHLKNNQTDDAPPLIKISGMDRFEGSNMLPVAIVQIMAAPRHVLLLDPKSSSTPLESVKAKKTSSVPPEMLSAMLGIKLDLTKVPREYKTTSNFGFKNNSQLILIQGQTVTRISEQINSSETFCAVSPKSGHQTNVIASSYDSLLLSAMVPKVISIDQIWYSSLTFFFTTSQESHQILSAQCLWPNQQLSVTAPMEMIRLLTPVIMPATSP